MCTFHVSFDSIVLAVYNRSGDTGFSILGRARVMLERSPHFPRHDLINVPTGIIRHQVSTTIQRIFIFRQKLY